MHRPDLILLSLALIYLASDTPSVKAAPYDPYDILYDVVMTRYDADGKPVRQDSPTPLLWTESRYLLREPTLTRFIAALDNFHALSDEEIRAYGPLKRALLQRQLWAVFDWSASLRSPSTEPVAFDLQSRLASLLKRLALSEKEIGSLPESIAQTMNTGDGEATAVDPALPADLYDASGPWVCLGRVRGGLIAPAHSEIAEWRSVFLVFIRLPGGRIATLQYLNELGSFRPTIVNGRQGLELNPGTPQFPIDTQFALVERPLLISDRGVPVMSPLCFRMQLRSYVSVSQVFVPGLSPKPTQSVAEFLLRPQSLLAGTGALEPLKLDQLHYALFFTRDPFERQGQSQNTHDHRPLRNCMTCHAAPGILSVNSRGFTQLTRDLPANFREVSPDVIAASTIVAKQQHYSWGLLNGLWRNEDASRSDATETSR